MKIFYIILLLFIQCVAYCSNSECECVYAFRVYLKDKGENGCSIDKPLKFLSADAIARREKQGIEITEADLPISPAYLDSLTRDGGKIMTSSKWFSTVVVQSKDSAFASTLKEISIVDSVKFVWKGKPFNTPKPAKENDRYELDESSIKAEYGYAEIQIKMLNGIRLHKAGFKGKGMKVAVIDAGFRNANRIEAFDKLNLLGTYNVHMPGESVFIGDDHGTKVLSCLAANHKGIMIGTAPEASYLLIKSEDNRSEYPIEEDYWTAAVEYADSFGIDVISSSLGYFSYDNKEGYTHTDLDGNHAMISKAASLAASKGILLFTSAGNEGGGHWSKITFPADAKDILTVGSVTKRKERSLFSSVGFTADERIKPDVVAMGSHCCVIDANGEISYANGTSFSTPILAGLGVCLWQAFPYLKYSDIIHLLQHSSSNFKNPTKEYGYGIPNVYKAYRYAKRHGSKFD